MVIDDILRDFKVLLSPETAGTINFAEYGVESPVGARPLEALLSVIALEGIERHQEEETNSRQKTGANWGKRSDTIGAVAGVVTQDVKSMVAGDKFGGLRADIDPTEIVERANEILEQTTREDTEALDATSRSAQVVDFTEAQERKAAQIAARRHLQELQSSELKVA